MRLNGSVLSLDQLHDRIAALHDLARVTPDGDAGWLCENPYFRSALAALELEWLVLRSVRGRAEDAEVGAASAAVESHIAAGLALRIAELAGEMAGPASAADRRGLGHNFTQVHAPATDRMDDYAALLVAAEQVEAATFERIARHILESVKRA